MRGLLAISCIVLVMLAVCPAAPARAAEEVLPPPTGSALVLREPKFSGQTRDGRHYELTAKTAEQPLHTPDPMLLDQARFASQTSSGNAITVSAAAGSYDRVNDLVTLRRDVVLTIGAAQIRLDKVTVDMGKKTLLVEEPVSFEWQDATFQANRLELSDNGFIVIGDGALTRAGDVIRFDRYALQ